ncbi:unnamed protein product [Prorocentrum cordatum]|uniref:Ubiquitinyl hydrolase 1 n=1 Tax=Prorocentrum cordatum TaxID=2364126 RepID=A0ABN9VFW8_9DINO|nr:unnamed protein product [Polarella glacialis]
MPGPALEPYHERQRGWQFGARGEQPAAGGWRSEAPPGAPRHLPRAEAGAIARAQLAEDRISRVARSGCLPASRDACSSAAWLAVGGNYDLQALLAALDRRGCHAAGHWAVETRGDVDRLERELGELAAGDAAPRVRGLLLNRRSRWSLGRHWYCLAASGRDGAWLCHDSTRGGPDPVAAGSLAAAAAEVARAELAQPCRCLRLCSGRGSALHVFAIAQAAP